MGAEDGGGEGGIEVIVFFENAGDLNGQVEEVVDKVFCGRTSRPGNCFPFFLVEECCRASDKSSTDLIG